MRKFLAFRANVFTVFCLPPHLLHHCHVPQDHWDFILICPLPFFQTAYAKTCSSFPFSLNNIIITTHSIALKT